jgi:hypothetical protein
MSDPTPPDQADHEPELPSSWRADEQEVLERSGRGPRLAYVIGGVVAALLLVLVALFAIDPFGSDEGELAWPGLVSGRPAGLGTTGQLAEEVTPDAEPGAYVWSDFDGWHLWVVFGPGIESVSGTITSDVDLPKGVLTPLDSGEFATEGQELTFELRGDVALSGIDFEPGFFAKQVQIDLDGPDGPLDPALVTQGAEGEVTALPLVIDKVPVGG